MTATPTVVDRSHIRVKAMLVAANGDASAHAVMLLPPSAENPYGYHRFVGGTVELGETHRAAMIREVREELGAEIRDLALLGVVENIFEIDGELGHEIAFLYTGRLDPMPAVGGGVITESDGSTYPLLWRPFDDVDEALPLYPAAARTLLPGRG